jgi:CRISPR-associated protein Csx17
MSEDRRWEHATREGSRRAQLRENLRLSVRERLGAVEELWEEGEVLRGSAQHPIARERPPEPRPADAVGRGRIRLPGCRPVPLGSYLKALGVLRLVSEQVDPSARGSWLGQSFTIRTRLSREELLEYLLREYRPTPILAPWNGGSGFYPKDSADALEALERSAAARFEGIRVAISCARGTIAAMGLGERPAGDAKDKLLNRLRAEMPAGALPWIDASVLLSGDGPKYPPLLGTGGNDGRLEFTNNFLQRVVELFDLSTGEPLPTATALLEDALLSVPVHALGKAAVGQFSPGAAGGPNATSGFSGDSRVNPWDFVLMLEGAVLFAARPARRLEGRTSGHLAFPFTVRSTGAGSGNMGSADEADARAETWMPLWSTDAALNEVRAFLGEGRVAVGRTTAGDGLDFARAVAKLGVDRGITGFERYGYLMRSGRAYLATPLGRVSVHRNPNADLIDQLDREQWLRRFRQFARGKNRPARLRRLAQRLEDALFSVARGTGGGERPFLETLILLGRIQEYFAVSPEARDACRPVPVLDPDWVDRADDGSAEFEIAASLASLHAIGETPAGGRSVVMPMATHLSPVEQRARGGLVLRTWSTDSGPQVVWGPGNLDANLARVVRRRLLQAKALDLGDVPLSAWRSISLDAVGQWLGGEVDEVRITDLLKGLSLTRVPKGHGTTRQNGLPLPAAYGLLKPLFVPRAILRRLGMLAQDAGLPLPLELVRLLEADRITDAIELGGRTLRVHGIHVPDRTVVLRSGSGPRLLSTLLAPVSPADLRYLMTGVFGRAGTPPLANNPTEKDHPR